MRTKQILTDAEDIIELCGKDFIKFSKENGGISIDDVSNIIKQKNIVSKMLEEEPKLLKWVIKIMSDKDLFITQNHGSIITDQVKPWIDRRKEDKSLKLYYYDRFQNQITKEKKMSFYAIGEIDKITDEILDCCGDPSINAPWRYRGMVVGHVQSGKTTNYIALINKAADYGYKVIIILAGLTNSLRTQTQLRADEYFIGYKTTNRPGFNAYTYPIAEGLGERRDPAIGTSAENDFNIKLVPQTVNLRTIKEPIIFVVKKNKRVLDNLVEWIEKQSEQNKSISSPLLVIDDEADHASVNTSKANTNPTAINDGIRKILKFFSRSTYIGYTATPFANIFILPESESGMIKDSLFPRNFIKTLEPPDNYCGADKIFHPRGELRSGTVRQVSDYRDIFPQKHNKNLFVKTELIGLPQSLEEAIRAHMISKAIRFLRGDGKKHSSMMINVSRFNDVQKETYRVIKDYWEVLLTAVFQNAKIINSKNLHLEKLEKVYENEFRNSGFTFNEIRDVLFDSCKMVDIKLINSKSTHKLDYHDIEKYKNTGQHVIAIGGLALSRGLTLEGLCTTYILRNAGAYDTLMQMARWFGYRKNYEDLCKLYLPRESIVHYEKTTEAIKELREELAAMRAHQKTPKDFGLKVRHHPRSIRITATNKMRSGSDITLAANYSGKDMQGYIISAKQKVVLENIKLVKDFLSKNKFSVQAGNYTNNNPYNSSDIIDLIESFSFPVDLLNLSCMGGRSLVSDYIRTCNQNEELLEWNVVIQSRKSAIEGSTPIKNWLPNTSINMIRRSTAKFMPDKSKIKLGAKNGIIFGDAWKLGLTKEQISKVRDEAKNNGLTEAKVASTYRSKPQLIILPILPNEKLKNKFNQTTLVSLALMFPNTETIVKAKKYMINSTLRKFYQREANELQDDDDDALDEGML